MYEYDNGDIDKLFPISPVESFRTTGQQLGQVIKFRTFYLKIYDEDINNYHIEGYLYGSDRVFTEVIKRRDMRRWAAQFTRDDYLSRYR